MSLAVSEEPITLMDMLALQSSAIIAREEQVSTAHCANSVAVYLNYDR